MRADDYWTRLIGGLRSGDEDVVAEFCREYGTHLERVAERHISPGMRRRVGPESVVQSACVSFLRRAREGQFDLPDSEALWRLLCAITLTKVREQTRFHLRQRRGVDRELDPRTSTSAPDPAAPDSDPGEALAIAEEFEHVLGGLEEEERRMVELKLQATPNPEIAAELGCSERTVRRLLAGLRERLERSLGET